MPSKEHLTQALELHITLLESIQKYNDIEKNWAVFPEVNAHLLYIGTRLLYNKLYLFNYCGYASSYMVKSDIFYFYQEIYYRMKLLSYIICKESFKTTIIA